MGKLFAGKVRWLINIFIIILIGFGLFLITVYNDFLKQVTAKHLNLYVGKVLGDRIILSEIESSNPKEKQKELLTYVAVAARSATVPVVNQLLQIRIGDIVTSYVQINHLVHDTQALRQLAMEKLSGLAK